VKKCKKEQKKYLKKLCQDNAEFYAYFKTVEKNAKNKKGFKALSCGCAPDLVEKTIYF
jgi:hypothetical protein